MPILVGGTHYYLEAILWSDFLAACTSSNEEGESMNIQLPSEMSDCYTLLQKLNPQVASQLHPNNARKVRKALREVLLSSSKQPSTSMRDEVEFGYPRNRSYHPRYPDETLILWVDCDLAVLDARLDSRVDNMVRTGLIHELDLFLKNYFTEPEFSKSDQARSDQLNRLFTETCSVNDPSGRRGILQTIGFKEFADYLSLPPGSAERESREGQQMLTAAIEKIKWITNRFLRRPEFGCIPVYRLDVTESMKSTTGLSADSWDVNILAPACRLVYDHLVDSGALAQFVIGDLARLNTLLDLCPPSARPRPCDLLPMRDESAHIGAGFSGDSPFSCTICGSRLFFRRADFEEHMRSRSHQKRISKLRRRQLINSIKC
ncbi:tRNA dimethylallyltransferase [Paragonimus heterotremus]|uniref:tRNA dimethylallyltransferase n=1 Tax=Paragonimus heterotremus TaxID=100268 RepID=A0A8J4WFL7_9TREM|nr:tRNA dimethylallyltransferase [Paragonimus heterotremus]